MKTSRSRSMTKAVTWRIVASITTAILVYIFTGDWSLSMGVGFFDVISKMILYYFHERLWNMTNWGQTKN